MVTRKREDPFTPDPKRGLDMKKMKEYTSPVPKTPLRNVLTPERNGVKHSSVLKEAAEILGSASKLRQSLSFENMKDEMDDDKRILVKKEDAAKRRRERKHNLMSPVVGSSPKAALPQSVGAKSSLKKSTSGEMLVSTPIASVIAGDIANRPLHGSGTKPKMTAEQMNRVFEEWIKIAADNKINAKNTWSLALIDYFSELTFVQDGNSINFQKASCTLDGCVKIYASRVDSVVDETSKLINGLSEGNFRNSKYFKGEIGDNESGLNDRENDEEDEEEDGKKKIGIGKKGSRHVNTLEKNPEALCLKQFDLEHTVDPLFRKTCAGFDESSSCRGMLLLSLSLSSSGQVIFDSADATPVGKQQSEQENTSSKMMDFSLLKAQLGTSLQNITERRLDETFADYNLTDEGKNGRLVEDQIAKAMERLSKVTIAPSNPMDDMMEVDGKVFDDSPFDHAPLMDDDYGACPPDNAIYDDDSGADEAFNHVFDEVAGGEAVEEVGEEEETSFGSGPPSAAQNMLSYFDETSAQGWAGPNHWKVRRPTTISRSTDSSKIGTKKPKGSFVLRFDDSAEIDMEALFAKPASSSTITLTKTAIEERGQRDNCLPEDLHFSSQNFLRLFIKPTWRFGSGIGTVRLRPKPVADTGKDDAINPETAEVNEEFWAQKAACPDGVADVHYDEDMNFGPLDGINDDYSAPFDNDDDDCGDYSQQMLTQQSTATNLSTFDLVTLKAGIQNQRLSFSRVAKRVDVHKLKQAIWEEIEEPAVESTENPKKFSNLVESLDHTSYPKEGLSDVSVPYCFICLLHLANEQNLTITSEGTDLVISKS